jgi:hypothetical protein
LLRDLTVDAGRSDSRFVRGLLGSPSVRLVGEWHFMAGEGAKLKVFISYTWARLAFADELVAGLEYEGGFEVHSIVTRS